MKQIVRKWILRLLATGFFSVGLLIGIVLNPSILYAKKTVIDSYVIHHTAPLDEAFFTAFRNALGSVEQSSIYDEKTTFEVCLNDGSYYPTLIEKVRGRAFGWGFSNKVVLRGTADYQANTVEIGRYKWNLSQLLAHEATHCLQFLKFGLWKSNPIAGYPDWKWEGYAEYIARRSANQNELVKNITRKLQQERVDPDGWDIVFDDETIAPRSYYQSWLLVQYCLEVKEIKYESLLKNESIDQISIEKEMMEWYNHQLEPSVLLPHH